MVKLSEEQYYKMYENLNKEKQRKVLQCIGADIGAFVGNFEIDVTTLKEIIAKKIEATICKESLEKYVDTLLKLRGDTKMKDLKLIENELVPVYETSTGEKVACGSELHRVLGSKSRFNDWIKNRFNDCEAKENKDYESFTKILVNGGRSIEYIIKLDIAKEMAMLERNEIGKQVRKYFIDIEKKYKTNNSFKLPTNYIEALEKLVETEKEKKKLAQQIEEQAPKVDFANAIAGSETSILVRDMAKILKQNGLDFGERKFFKWLRENKYLISQKGESYNTPSQTSMNLKIMEIKESIYYDSNGEPQISKTPVVTGKGQKYFVNKFLKDKTLSNGFKKINLMVSIS